MGSISNCWGRIRSKFRPEYKQGTMFGIDPEPPQAEPEKRIVMLDFIGHPIPVLTCAGDDMSWWPAQLICDILEIKNVSKACGRIDEDEKGITTSDTFSQNGTRHKVLIVNQWGAYNLALDSRKPEAKKFRRWLTHEVIPSIHKTGSYSLPGATPEACDRAKERNRNRKQNRKDQDRYRDMGAHVNDIVAHHNAIYLGQFGMAAPELRTLLGMSGGTPLDRMGPVPLSANTHAKVLCERLFEDAEKEGRGVPLKDRPAIEETKAREVQADTMASLGGDYHVNIVEHARGDIIDVEKTSLGKPNRLKLTS